MSTNGLASSPTGNMDSIGDPAQPLLQATAPRDVPSPLTGGLIDALGRTPLVRFDRIAPARTELWGKLEGLNPGGSSKARPAARMIADALSDGRLRPGGTVVESSSGNMGIGLAGACALRDLHFICVVDQRTNPLALGTMRALGAELRMIDADRLGGRSMLEARLELVGEIVASTPGAFWPNQYENPSNPTSHAVGTMREIDEALDGRIDYLFAAAGTAGTLRGCLDYLEAAGRECRVVAVDACGSALFGGAPGSRRLPGMGAGIETRHSRACAPDRLVRVSDLDCVVGCRRMARREGLVVGASSGGVLSAVAELAPELPSGARCVAILPDLGSGYLETVFDDRWVELELGVDPVELRRLVEAPGGTAGR